ncbi:MAG: hypothetical protein AUI10_06645 [Actinobacteria bacterium 13_2_20CM_2_72_6]|nr:MAG: hypothetical protein AUI10_06645 [Actinobacteria bacterium 13_2_20CM_2_72_6]
MARTVPASRTVKPVRALPTPLRLAVALLFVEALGIGAVAVLFAYYGLTRKADSTGSAVTVVVFPAAVAVLLGLLSVTLARARAWARGPSIALELLLVPIGYYMTVGGTPWLGVPMIVAALACTGLLLAPATRTALGIR